MKRSHTSAFEVCEAEKKAGALFAKFFDANCACADRFSRFEEILKDTFYDKTFRKFEILYTEYIDVLLVKRTSTKLYNYAQALHGIVTDFIKFFDAFEKDIKRKRDFGYKLFEFDRKCEDMNRTLKIPKYADERRIVQNDLLQDA